MRIATYRHNNTRHVGRVSSDGFHVQAFEQLLGQGGDAFPQRGISDLGTDFFTIRRINVGWLLEFLLHLTY